MIIHNVIELMKEANSRFPDDRAKRLEWYNFERAHMEEKPKAKKKKEKKNGLSENVL